MERHLATVWESVADAIGDEDAVVQGARRLAWGDLERRASLLAGVLGEAGVAAGSKVAQYLHNAPEYLESYFATLKMRAVPVNVNYRYLDDELLYLLENSEAEALVYHGALADRVARVKDRATGVKVWIEVADDGAAHEANVDGAMGYEPAIAASRPAPRITRDPDDITMLYTGGTTGMPKGVMSRVGSTTATHMATLPPMVGLAPVTDPSEVAGVARRLVDEGRQVATLPACPLMHGTGLAGAATSMTFGSKTVLLAGHGLDPGELWSAVQDEAVYAIVIVGDPFARPMLAALRAGGSWDLGSVRFIHSAGAMFSAPIREGLFEYLPDAVIVDHIAASEGGMGVALSRRGAVVATGTFTPHPGVRVLDERGVAVEPGSGATGRVSIPDAAPLGYYRDEEKTAQTFPEIDGVRYSVPGDWATVETDGSITLLGRGSQCINTGGEKVFPEEVEEAIKLHAAVEDCLVFGVDDERFGQRVVAVASVVAPVEAVEVISATRDRLAAYKVPRQLLVVERVPRAPNGKADYAGARKLFEAADS